MGGHYGLSMARLAASRNQNRAGFSRPAIPVVARRRASLAGPSTTRPQTASLPHKIVASRE
jgi:hypothetical protein